MNDFRTTLMGLIVVAAGLAASPAGADPGEDDFNYAKGCFIDEDYWGAVEAYEDYINTYPDGPNVARAHYQIGQSYFRLEEYDDAIKAFVAAWKKFPDADEDAPIGCYNLGHSYLNKKNYEKAIPPFEFAIENGNDKIREESIVAKGESLIKTSQLDKAAALYAAFLEEFKESLHRPAVFFSRGWALLETEQHEAAIAALTELLKTYPSHSTASKAMLALSDAYSALEQYEEAEKLLDELMTEESQVEEAKLRLAWNRFNSGDKASAAKSFIAFAESYPQHKLYATVLYNAGIAYYDLNEYDRAIGVFRRILKDREDSKEAGELQFWLGLCLFESEKFDEAVQVIKKQLEAGGQDKERAGSLIYTYAEALSALDRTKDAIDWFRKLATEHPESKYIENAMYSLALAQQKDEDLTSAIATLASLLEKFPETELKEHVYFALGEYLTREERHEEAEKWLDLLAELPKSASEQNGDAQPDKEKGSAKVLYRRAWTKFDREKYDESMPLFREIADMKNEFQTEALYMCGRSAEHLGRTETAIEDYEKLKATGRKDEFVEKAYHRLGFLYQGDELVNNIDDYEVNYPNGQFAAVLRLKMAENCYNEGNVDGAVKHYDILQKKELSAELQESVNYGLGWCWWLEKEDVQKADSFFAKVTDGDITRTMVRDAILQRGEIAYAAKEYEKAKAFFKNLKHLDSNRGERALYMLGWIALRMKNNESVVTNFKGLRERFPKSEFATDAAIRLAEALNEADKLEESESVLKAAIQNPDSSLEEDLLHLYLETLVKRKDWQAVTEVCNELAGKFPTSERRYLISFNLGVAHKEIGIFDKAIEFFKQTMAETETREAAVALFNIGSIHFSQEKYLEAAKTYLKVEKLYDYEDLSAKSLYHAIDTFHRAGPKHVKRANVYLKKLRKSYPDSPWTKKAGELEAPTEKSTEQPDSGGNVPPAEKPNGDKNADVNQPGGPGG